MEIIKKQFIASDVSFSETQQSEIYQSIRLRMFDTGANLNGVCVTEAFIDDIVMNAEKYICIPLCADINRINSGDLNNLGHMYDSRTGEFHSQQIGSFYSFEKESFDGGCALIGEARVMKRNEKVCKALAELFERGELNFSFEVCAADYTRRDDGILVIDVSENNYLEGMAVVSNPAYESAKALQLVAEAEEGKENKMDTATVTSECEVKEEVVEQISEVVDEAEKSVETAGFIDIANNSEQPDMEKQPEEEKPEETAEAETAAEENAACDPEKQEEGCDNKECSEEEDAACGKKKCAEETNMIAEVVDAINAMRRELAAYKTEIENLKQHIDEKFVSELIASEDETVNPFVSEISTEKSKYSLLESDDTSSKKEHYSLLEKA